MGEIDMPVLLRVLRVVPLLAVVVSLSTTSSGQAVNQALVSGTTCNAQMNPLVGSGPGGVLIGVCGDVIDGNTSTTLTFQSNAWPGYYDGTLEVLLAQPAAISLVEIVHALPGTGSGSWTVELKDGGVWQLVMSGSGNFGTTTDSMATSSGNVTEIRVSSAGGGGNQTQSDYVISEIRVFGVGTPPCMATISPVAWAPNLITGTSPVSQVFDAGPMPVGALTGPSPWSFAPGPGWPSGLVTLTVGSDTSATLTADPAAGMVSALYSGGTLTWTGQCNGQPTTQVVIVDVQVHPATCMVDVSPATWTPTVRPGGQALSRSFVASPLPGGVLTATNPWSFTPGPGWPSGLVCLCNSSNTGATLVTQAGLGSPQMTYTGGVLTWTGQCSGQPSSQSVTVDVAVDPTGLIAHWTFDNPSNPGEDATGNHQGFLQGSASLSGVTPPVPGNVNALSLSAPGDQVIVPHSSAFNFGAAQPMSFAFWARKGQSQPVYHIFGKRLRCGAIQYQLARDSSAGLYLRSGPTNFYLGAEPTSVSWSHFAFTFDGFIARGYVDAVETLAATWSFAGANSEDLVLGHSGTCPSGGSFLGSLDDVRFYDRALTPVEIQAVFAGHVGALSFPGSGADFELRTGINAATCTTGSGLDLKTAAELDVLSVCLASPGGGLYGAPVILGAAISPAGTPVVSGPASGLWLPVPGLFLLIDGTVLTPLGPSAVVGPNGLTLGLQIPTGLSGDQVLLQAAAICGSTAGCSFELSEAHLITVL